MNMQRVSIDELIPSVTIPEGEKGDAKITHFTIDQEGAARYNMRLMMNDQGHRAVSPGSYTRLVADGRLQMTDTPAEKRDHIDVVQHAKGSVLITGLGLGMVANACALKPQVTSVTVIEINQNVIDLVKPTLHRKVKVICADALEWKGKRGQKWDVIWHDIWPDINLDDCESRAKLSRMYARRWTVYHGAWAKDEIRRQQQKDRSRTGYAWW